MKKYFVLAVFMISVMSLFAEPAFVKVRVCPVFQEASSNSAKLTILKHSTEVDVISVEDEWSKINVNGQTGYVQNMFIGADAGVQVSSVAENKSALSSIEVRKRASNFTSSAAASRGLAKENVRDRENVAFTSFDFTSINWIEDTFSYTEDDLLAFAEQEYINY